MANLFGKNKLREIAEAIDTDSVQDFIAVVKNWQQDYHNGSLKKDKETSREQQYNRDFFLDILGYKEKPASPFSFEPKATTDKGQLPDAVISHTDTANGIRNIAAVVELKGASIDLDRPQRREGNMSPVQQGFKYKTQYRSVPFVIVSNFWEFRLYHDNLLDYEVWTLDDLVNPDDDYLLFKTWYALLKKDSFTTAKGTSKTEAILSDIRIEQENIGKKFYKVYKEARTELLRDIYKHNDYIKTDIDTGIEKAQKIIDRIVFAAFAEDRGLLPDNTLLRVIQAADSSAFGGSLWNTLKGFFEAIDVGSEKLEIPNGYNGGLFKHDEVLNNLKISDEPLRKVVELGTYNFAEDLSVNILGHIFEQSISDLEEIKNKVNESQSLEAISQSRRKKDGIFYTPDYIVRYIVDNSLGTYLREHEEKFKAEFGLKGDILDKTYEKRERQAYTKYQDFLQGIKVVDPACGSGAFLVYVFDYLLAENKRVGDILGMSLFSTDEYIRDILRNNIYGVDLNEESVEITKLSLWLKTAQKGKKLTSLDNNIKCGNSLVDDTEIAGDKAFSWQEQFADVFKNGGFDVVVGNPPYGESIKDGKSYFDDHFESSQGKYEIYKFFIEHGLKLVRPSGYLSFIAPDTWYKLGSFANLRRYILVNSTIIKATESLYGVFTDAVVDTSIFVLKKVATNQKQINIVSLNLLDSFTTDIGKAGLIETRIANPLIKKLDSIPTRLGDVSEIWQGLIAYHSKNQPREYSSDVKENDTYRKLLFGNNISRYSINWKGGYLSYGSWLHRPRPARIFDEPKILVQRIRNPKLHRRLVCAIDNKAHVNGTGLSNILVTDASVNLQFLLGIVNSSLINYWFAFHYSDVNIKPEQLRTIPLARNDTYEIEISHLSETLSLHLENIKEVSSHFEKLLSSEFSLEKWPTKLNKWWTLEFNIFVKTLKVELSLAQKDDLLSMYDKYRSELTDLTNSAQKTERKIDQIVYQLYELSDKEIALVEAS